VLFLGRVYTASLSDSGGSKVSTVLETRAPRISRMRVARPTVIPWYSLRSSHETCDLHPRHDNEIQLLWR
jgi:hypothetical protein